MNLPWSVWVLWGVFVLATGCVAWMGVLALLSLRHGPEKCGRPGCRVCDRPVNDNGRKDDDDDGPWAMS